MKIKFLLSAVVLLLAAGFSYAQKLSGINVLPVSDEAVILKSVKISIGQTAILVDTRGRIKLVPDYDSVEDENNFDGSWQSLHPAKAGKLNITYWDQFDSDNAGKIKSIGDVNVSYYDRFDLDNQGKIQSVGKNKITYYDRFDLDNNGRVKSIGNIRFTYYDRFDLDNAGKLKSVDNLKLVYYDRFDPGRQGKLKSFGTITFSRSFNNREVAYGSEHVKIFYGN